MIRNYGIGAQIIKSLNIKNMILVTRSPKKIVSLEGFGLKIIKTRNYKMKKKYLIVVSDYYKDISNGLLKSAKFKIKKLSLLLK